MNWTDLKVQIESAIPGDIIKIPKGIGPPPSGKISIPKGVTVILSEPFPLFQIFKTVHNTDGLEWWGKHLTSRCSRPVRTGG